MLCSRSIPLDIFLLIISQSYLALLKKFVLSLTCGSYNLMVLSFSKFSITAKLKEEKISTYCSHYGFRISLCLSFLYFINSLLLTSWSHTRCCHLCSFSNFEVFPSPGLFRFSYGIFQCILSRIWLKWKNFYLKVLTKIQV